MPQKKEQLYRNTNPKQPNKLQAGVLLPAPIIVSGGQVLHGLVVRGQLVEVVVLLAERIPPQETAIDRHGERLDRSLALQSRG